MIDNRVSRRRTVWVAMLLAVIDVAWALRAGAIGVTEASNRWAPLRIDTGPNLLTGIKL